jgi:putative thioredoxin
MAKSAYVMDVSEAEFQARVVEQSRTVPVVVDFWAPWCGPCRALSPLLEELTEEAEGQFLLAKVNVDENPQLAQMFQVQGIPAVFAVKDAKVLDAFTGLLNEDQLRDFLSVLTPSAEMTELSRIMGLATSDPQAGIVALRELLGQYPESHAVRVSLASLLVEVGGHSEEAESLIRPIDSGDYAAAAERLKRILALQTVPHSDDDLATAQAEHQAVPEDPQRRMALAGILAARGDYADALEHYYQAAELDRTLAGGPIREAMVNLFHIVGVRGELADEYRDKLRALLY